jgi:plasmid stabilization system protein ParE
MWEEGGRPDVRSIIYESHRIAYRVRKDEIAILSVRHTRRLPPEDVDK